MGQSFDAGWKYSLEKPHEAPHDFVRQLLNNDNLSIKRLILTSQMTIKNQSIDGNVILQENDSVNLRLFEAFYIRKWKP